MRSPGRLHPLVAAVTLTGVALVAGCTAGRVTNAPAVPPDSHEPAPRLGGRVPAHRAVPRRAMSRFEQPVAARLARRVAHDGLTLAYLDCPPWDGMLPRRMTCRGYVDGLVAEVRVEVRAGVRGQGVRFGAWLGRGLIATHTLERTLVRQGWSGPDCGAVAAYPAQVGDTIVCRVTRSGRDHYVVATVTDRSGAVRIAGYRPGG